MLASQADNAKSRMGSMAVVGVLVEDISVVIIKYGISIIASMQIRTDIRWVR